MSFLYKARLVLDKRSSQGLPIKVRTDFERRRLIVEPAGDSIKFLAQEDGNLAGNRVDVTIATTEWKVAGNFWLQNDQKRKIDLTELSGPTYLTLFYALDSGQLLGEAAEYAVHEILRFVEVMNKPKDGKSWLETYFPEYFKYEQSLIDRAHVKIVKRTMSS
jgi:hypothetical protein